MTLKYTDYDKKRLVSPLYGCPVVICGTHGELEVRGCLVEA